LVELRARARLARISSSRSSGRTWTRCRSWTRSPMRSRRRSSVD